MVYILFLECKNGSFGTHWQDKIYYSSTNTVQVNNLFRNAPVIRSCDMMIVEEQELSATFWCSILGTSSYENKIKCKQF